MTKLFEIHESVFERDISINQQASKEIVFDLTSEVFGPGRIPIGIIIVDYELPTSVAITGYSIELGSGNIISGKVKFLLTNFANIPVEGHAKITVVFAVKTI